MKSIRLIVSAIVIASGAAAVALAADPPKGGTAPAATPPPAAAPAAGKAFMSPAAELKWAPFNPADPKGLQVSFVAGDGKAATFTQFLLKMPPGAKAPQHLHNVDYYGTVISGEPAHGDDEKSAKTHVAGTAWFEPAKHPHFDACPGKTECIVLITEPMGPPDFVPVGADGKPLPPPAAPKAK